MISEKMSSMCICPDARSDMLIFQIWSRESALSDNQMLIRSIYRSTAIKSCCEWQKQSESQSDRVNRRPKSARVG